MVNIFRDYGSITEYRTRQSWNIWPAGIILKPIIWLTMIAREILKTIGYWIYK